MGSVPGPGELRFTEERIPAREIAVFLAKLFPFFTTKRD
jgi:hypothetical protein